MANSLERKNEVFSLQRDIGVMEKEIENFFFHHAICQSTNFQTKNMVNQHKRLIPRTAHYYTIGEPNPDITDVWIVCHGYGQVAEHFIKKFDVLDDGKTLVIAPEGHSRFYWEGMSRKPVATWMTSRHRLDEIADYTRYIKALYDEFIPQLHPEVRINLLGFSQGTATQCRWILREYPAFHRLILWAGLLPDDLDFKIHETYLQDKEIIFVYGTADQFLTEKRIKWQYDYAAKYDLKIDQTIVFEGKHVMLREVIQQLK